MVYLIIEHLALAIVLTTFTQEILFGIKLRAPKWSQWFISKLYCLKCVTMWLTVLLTHDIYLAAICAAIVILTERYYGN